MSIKTKKTKDVISQIFKPETLNYGLAEFSDYEIDEEEEEEGELWYE